MLHHNTTEPNSSVLLQNWTEVGKKNSKTNSLKAAPKCKFSVPNKQPSILRAWEELLGSAASTPHFNPNSCQHRALRKAAGEGRDPPPRLPKGTMHWEEQSPLPGLLVNCCWLETQLGGEWETRPLTSTKGSNRPWKAFHGEQGANIT